MDTHRLLTLLELGEGWREPRGWTIPLAEGVRSSSFSGRHGEEGVVGRGAAQVKQGDVKRLPRVLGKNGKARGRVPKVKGWWKGGAQESAVFGKSP